MIFVTNGMNDVLSMDITVIMEKVHIIGILAILNSMKMDTNILSK